MAANEDLLVRTDPYDDLSSSAQLAWGTLSGNETVGSLMDAFEKDRHDVIVYLDIRLVGFDKSDDPIPLTAKQLSLLLQTLKGHAPVMSETAMTETTLLQRNHATLLSRNIYLEVNDASPALSTAVSQVLEIAYAKASFDTNGSGSKDIPLDALYAVLEKDAKVSSSPVTFYLLNPPGPRGAYAYVSPHSRCRSSHGLSHGTSGLAASATRFLWWDIRAEQEELGPGVVGSGLWHGKSLSFPLNIVSGIVSSLEVLLIPRISHVTPHLDVTLAPLQSSQPSSRVVAVNIGRGSSSTSQSVHLEDLNALGGEFLFFSSTWEQIDIGWDENPGILLAFQTAIQVRRAPSATPSGGLQEHLHTFLNSSLLFSMLGNGPLSSLQSRFSCQPQDRCFLLLILHTHRYDLLLLDEHHPVLADPSHTWAVGVTSASGSFHPDLKCAGTVASVPAGHPQRSIQAMALHLVTGAPLSLTSYFSAIHHGMKNDFMWAQAHGLFTSDLVVFPAGSPVQWNFAEADMLRRSMIMSLMHTLRQKMLRVKEVLGVEVLGSADQAGNYQDAVLVAHWQLFVAKWQKAVVLLGLHHYREAWQLARSMVHDVNYWENTMYNLNRLDVGTKHFVCATDDAEIVTDWLTPFVLYALAALMGVIGILIMTQRPGKLKIL